MDSFRFALAFLLLPTLVSPAAAAPFAALDPFARPVSLRLATMLERDTAPQQAPARATGTVVVRAVSGSRVVEQVEVGAGDVAALTDRRGEAVLELPSGEWLLELRRFGFVAQTVRVTVRPGIEIRVTVDLRAEPTVEEEVFVTATRAGKRLRDEPLRVEVLDREEIEEKALMTPGDIAMLLNETGGLRVQVTAPSLGAANVRIQGLRGRYTQLLADGLPLYGGQTGAIGLLQIPPLDLGQVEVIKGAASALYGGSALGGVINLVSRRPDDEEHERELLLNRTTQDGTDAVLWLSGPLTEGWGFTLLGGGHLQERADPDRDGWADVPGYRRLVVRPRLFWEEGTGRSLFATVGIMREARRGGTMGGAVVPDGSPFVEELDSARFDTGLIARFLVAGDRLFTIRMSGMTQGHTHIFGDTTERDRHSTWFGEVSVNGSDRGHTWVAGAALQRDDYRSVDVPSFDHGNTTPGLFLQDDYSVASWLTVSASARLDFRDATAFLSPRVSGLIRLEEEWTVRVSVGSGYFAPTPFIEETEAVGLSRVAMPRPLRAERGRSISLDIGRSFGPLETNATVFGSVVRNALALVESQAVPGRLDIVNTDGPTRASGIDLVARLRHEPLSLTASYAFLRSSEPQERRRREVPLTPRHSFGLVTVLEDHEQGRIGFEMFYTGRQYLDDNPYRVSSRPYLVMGILGERRVGWARLFLNLENLTNVRQTRFDRLVRPARGFDGRWTVDAWAPLEGRVINGGMRLSF
jgi:outer membrane receptor for ferrienterochelin and colicins